MAARIVFKYKGTIIAEYFVESEQLVHQQGGRMMVDNYSKAKTIALMFAGGAVVGAAAGLLLAPKSGKETRDDIKGYAEKVSKSVTDIAHRSKVSIEAALEKGRALLAEKAA